MAASKKTCCKCKVEKVRSSFNKNKTKPDGLHNVCRVCAKQISKDYYRSNRTRLIAEAKSRNDSYRRANRDYVANYLSTHPCVDCGETDLVLLQFDHVRGEKSATISSLVHDASSMEVLVEEIKKCDVRCVVCHTRRTAAQLNWWILEYV